MSTEVSAFIHLLRHPIKFRLFLLSKLPSALFSGVRITQVDEEHCEVVVPYKWFTKNPFRSTYFACLSMAAEMSTGALCLLHLYKKPPVSMLVLKVNSEYFKKATGRTRFVCDDGKRIRNAIDSVIASGDAQAITTRSVGRNKDGVVIAEFSITWSFKSRAQVHKDTAPNESLQNKSPRDNPSPAAHDL